VSDILMAVGDSLKIFVLDGNCRASALLKVIYLFLLFVINKLYTWYKTEDNRRNVAFRTCKKLKLKTDVPVYSKKVKYP